MHKIKKVNENIYLNNIKLKITEIIKKETLIVFLNCTVPVFKYYW